MKPEDRAQELELMEWEENQRKAILPVQTRPSAKKCVDCDADIPKARQQAVPGVLRCTECEVQNAFVKKQQKQRV